MGYSPWGHKESDTTEQLILSLITIMHEYNAIYYYALLITESCFLKIHILKSSYKK